MGFTTTVKINDVAWSAHFADDGDVTITRDDEEFDKGFDDGQMICDTERTPEDVLLALESDHQREEWGE
jgi:hypothetical protein